jgi:uncharacterized protein YjbJ (UPF0337 family)
MNKETLKGQWKQLKGQVRKQWGKLTDDDLDQIHGDAEILAGKIQERYGRAKDEAQREVDKFFKDQSQAWGSGVSWQGTASREENPNHCEKISLCIAWTEAQAEAIVSR